MREVVLAFVKAAEADGRYLHPIDLFLDLEPELKRIDREVCQGLCLAEEMPFLGALVCASPVDAAIHDAFGNGNGISVYDGYGPEHMAHDLGHYLGPAFRGRYPQDCLRRSYAPELPAFHLVGGLDRLRRAEVTNADPQDGLPNSLDAWVERDGLTCLKIKLRGDDLGWDVDRIAEVARVAREAQGRIGQSDLCFSADTNEQCETPDYVVELLARLRERDGRAFEELLYVEQPTERDLTAHRWDMRPLAKVKPVIVDESLTDLASFDLAMDLGWSGVALKACKGQSKTVLTAAKAEGLGVPYTVQDLGCPGIALLQSAGIAARLNPMKGVEANGRQFFPQASADVAKVHPGLFRVRGGRVRTESLAGTGFGFRMEEIA
jgi:L-alanine-DL-glutamate epimerase-like enolase superfamily enzyme